MIPLAVVGICIVFSNTNTIYIKTNKFPILGRRRSICTGNKNEFRRYRDRYAICQVATERNS